MATGDNYGFFWDSVSGDRTYNSASFETWLKKFFTSGVFANELYVTANGGMQIAVSGGYANVDGKMMMFDNSTFTLSNANSTYPRIDTVVVRRTNADRAITLAVVTGQYSGSSPQPTAPVRTGGVYELVLAEVYVGNGVTSISQANITDKRLDRNVCGYVIGTVDEIDVEQFLAQYTAQWNYWFNNVKDELSDDAAGHLQDEIDTLEGTVTEDISALQTDVGALQTSMSGKQDALTFDTTPTSGSTNPVTSGGIYNAIPKISMGTATPTGGNNGDIYFQYS